MMLNVTIMMNEFGGPTQLEIFIYLLIIVQMWLTVRYVVKAIVGDVPSYSVLKLLMVFFIPIYGYYLATKEPVEIS